MVNEPGRQVSFLRLLASPVEFLGRGDFLLGHRTLRDMKVEVMG